MDPPIGPDARAAFAAGGARPLHAYGRRVNSQNGEDGILHAILCDIGVADVRRCVEMCAGTGAQSNTANLILRHGFQGVLFDGDERNVRVCDHFFATMGCRERAEPVCAWITCENVAGLLRRHVPDPDVDVLSLDMDGVDWWVLREVLRSGALRPRVIVLEYQDIVGPTEALTVPYDPRFDGWAGDAEGGPNYCGASLAAFVHLLGKDYAFVGCEAAGFNGFFVRRSEMREDALIGEMVDVAPCFDAPKVRAGMATRWPRVRHLPWVDVRGLS